MENVALTLEELTGEMLSRMRRWTSQVFPDFKPPPLPPGLALPTAEMIASHPHYCAHAPVVTLPIVLVVPGVRIYFESPQDRFYVPEPDFTEPYWIGPMKVVHDGAPLREESRLRPATVIENASALCQYHFMGSLRSLNLTWPAQVFCLSSAIVGMMSGSGPGHHVTWAPVNQVVKPRSFLCWGTR